MRFVFILIRDYYRALWACRREWLSFHLPERARRPFVSAAPCIETVGYIYLLAAGDFPGPHDVNWAQGRWIATDLGDRRPLRLARLARDGSLVFKAQESVLRVVVLPPGMTIPERHLDRCRLALEAVGRKLP